MSESYLLMAGETDSGEKIDEEQIRDLLGLSCLDAVQTYVNVDKYRAQLDSYLEKFNNEVTERNATHLLQQEALIDAERRDHQASYFAKIRELESKENNALKDARSASDAISRLKLTQQARNIRSRIEELEDEYREVRNNLREQSNKQLSLAADALVPTIIREKLFSINWQVID